MDTFIGALYNLYKADKILSDASLTRFSIDFKNQKTPTMDAEFSLCSDRFATQFSGYTVDEKGRVVPKEETLTHNFDELKKHLLS